MTNLTAPPPPRPLLTPSARPTGAPGAGPAAPARFSLSGVAIAAALPHAAQAQTSQSAQGVPPPFAAAGPVVVPLLTPLLVGAYRLCFPNCRPNQILVIAGRRHPRGDGQTIGYRVITGGRAFALPLLERCSWMDVRTVQVAIQVEKAYAKGGTPINVEAIATVKIDSDAASVGNAIERFLQHDPKELVEEAQNPGGPIAGHGGRPQPGAGERRPAALCP